MFTREVFFKYSKNRLSASCNMIDLIPYSKYNRIILITKSKPLHVSIILYSQENSQNNKF